MLGPTASVARRVLPPSDGVACLRRAQDVQVAITVHVCGIHTRRPEKVSVHGVLREHAAGGGRRRDGDLVVFDLAVARLTDGRQVARRTEPETSVCRAVQRPAGYVEGDRVDAVHYGNAIGNVLVRSAPTAINIKVDPRIQLGAAGSILHVDGDARIGLTHLDRSEGDAVLVVGRPGGVVRVCVGRMDAIGLAVTLGPQSRAGWAMPSTVFGQRRCVRRRRVAEIKSRQQSPVFQHLGVDLQCPESHNATVWLPTPADAPETTPTGAASELALQRTQPMEQQHDSRLSRMVTWGSEILGSVATTSIPLLMLRGTICRTWTIPVRVNTRRFDIIWRKKWQCGACDGSRPEVKWKSSEESWTRKFLADWPGRRCFGILWNTEVVGGSSFNAQPEQRFARSGLRRQILNAL